MKRRSTMWFLMLTVMIFAEAQAADGYRVAPDKRHLLGPNGKPFFWLGDTAWKLCHTLDRADTAHYLDTRAKQGFTVIQLPAVMSRYVGRTNAFGDKPFLDDKAFGKVSKGNLGGSKNGRTHAARPLPEFWNAILLVAPYLGGRAASFGVGRLNGTVPGPRILLELWGPPGFVSAVARTPLLQANHRSLP